MHLGLVYCSLATIDQRDTIRFGFLCHSLENCLLFFRWKRTSAGVMLDGGKKVLEFVAIQRRDNSQWAIPGVSCFLYYTAIFVTEV